MTHTQANEPGFVLVPREPTEAMLDAAHEVPIACFGDDVECFTTNREASSLYRAMLAAAPIVPAPAYGVKNRDIKELWVAHGGSQHGPRVETYTIPEVSFWKFIDSLRERLSSAPVEEADAKAGEPVAFLVHNPIVTNIVRERESLFPASRENDAREFAKLLRADCTPLYAALAASTIPSEPEAKGEAGAGPVDEARDEGWQPIETAPTGGKFGCFLTLAFGPPGDQTVSEGMHFHGRFYAASVFYTGGPHDTKQFTFREHEVKPTHWRPTIAAPGAARPVEEPSVVERLKRERDAQYEENVNRIAAEGAAVLRAETAETALAETRERLEKVEAALAELVDYYDTGHDQNAFLEAARAALSTQESSAALAGDGKERGR